MKLNNNVIAIALASLVIGGAVGFFGGTQHQKNQRFGGTMQFDNGQFQGRMAAGTGAGTGNRMRNGGAVTGEIISTDSASITIKLEDGSSKIVLLTDATSINKASEGTKADLTVGTKVAAFGPTNTDGSVTAQNVQLNPMMRERMGTTGSGTPRP